MRHRGQPRGGLRAALYLYSTRCMRMESMSGSRMRPSQAPSRRRSAMAGRRINQVELVEIGWWRRLAGGVWPWHAVCATGPVCAGRAAAVWSLRFEAAERFASRGRGRWDHTGSAGHAALGAAVAQAWRDGGAEALRSKGRCHGRGWARGGGRDWRPSWPRGPLVRGVPRGHVKCVPMWRTTLMFAQVRKYRASSVSRSK